MPFAFSTSTSHLQEHGVGEHGTGGAMAAIWVSDVMVKHRTSWPQMRTSVAEGDRNPDPWMVMGIPESGPALGVTDDIVGGGSGGSRVIEMSSIAKSLPEYAGFVSTIEIVALVPDGPLQASEKSCQLHV